MTFVTRFAPSPTGPLHLGHAYSALIGFHIAQAAGGQFLLRIDDLDQTRARPEWEAQLQDDLHWLGLDWPCPLRRQSQHLVNYGAALDRLSAMDLTYPCSCTRRDIAAAASAPQEGAPQTGPDGLIYPGTCRGRGMAEAGPDDAIRLNMVKATRALPELTFTETGPNHKGVHKLSPETLIHEVGDVVLSRRQMGASYHLAVVIDDTAQEITHVVRGEDLFEATSLHVLLQHLLGLPTPIYHHHELIRDESGRRLAKRDDARAIATYRADGMSPEDIRSILPPLSDI
ncbi:glutamyl-Q tRNA(Asp) synthetase [Poseidonocella pacifica]|uniref:Glutamyl-Q tRNA(Asp) synthetase n=1 Tax=Poseidonocella pacifica TaxID=871651 RepID=A0A1I0VTN6_9RHOB|nr:tRNA glutamyl-Q(34) synthetase GluQRS [Poseidonocella pacifica]SFA79662.1 glutamyl-Q tRNA(Asp) synthetase [Poseidonocella pacifica]